MMGIMAKERGGAVFATDERLLLSVLPSILFKTDFRFRFCIDNGIMIAHAGLLSYRMGYTTPIEEAVITQRFDFLLNISSSCSTVLM